MTEAETYSCFPWPSSFRLAKVKRRLPKLAGHREGRDAGEAAVGEDKASGKRKLGTDNPKVRRCRRA
eukprot:6183995-Pleurochrysis_carterae.AAC.2